MKSFWIPIIWNVLMLGAVGAFLATKWFRTVRQRRAEMADLIEAIQYGNWNEQVVATKIERVIEISRLYGIPLHDFKIQSVTALQILGSKSVRRYRAQHRLTSRELRHTNAQLGDPNPNDSSEIAYTEALRSAISKPI